MEKRNTKPSRRRRVPSGPPCDGRYDDSRHLIAYWYVWPNGPARHHRRRSCCSRFPWKSRTKIEEAESRLVDFIRESKTPASEKPPPRKPRPAADLEAWQKTLKTTAAPRTFDRGIAARRKQGASMDFGTDRSQSFVRRPAYGRRTRHELPCGPRGLKAINTFFQVRPLRQTPWSSSPFHDRAATKKPRRDRRRPKGSPTPKAISTSPSTRITTALGWPTPKGPSCARSLAWFGYGIFIIWPAA